MKFQSILLLKFKVLFLITGLMVGNYVYGMKTTTPTPHLKDIPSWFGGKNSNLKQLQESQKVGKTTDQPLTRQEKASREEKEAMTPEQRQRYKADRTATKAADRAAMSDDERKAYDQARAARKATKASTAEEPEKKTSDTTASSTTTKKQQRLSTQINEESPLTIPPQLTTEEKENMKKNDPEKYAQYKKDEAAAKKQLAGIISEEKKVLQEMRTPTEQAKYLANKYGKWIIGAAALALMPAGAGGLGLGSLLTGGDDTPSAGGQTTIQIFDGGSSSSVEGYSFTPSSAINSDAASTNTASGESFEAVAPPVD